MLKNLWWRLDSALTTEDCYYSALIALLDSIRHGTTTLIDHHASPQAVRGSLAAIERAVKQTGLRACLCYELSDRDGARISKEGLEENAAFIRHCQKAEAGAEAEVSVKAAFKVRGSRFKRRARSSPAPTSALANSPPSSACMRRSRSRTPRWKRPPPWATNWAPAFTSTSPRPQSDQEYSQRQPPASAWWNG